MLTAPSVEAISHEGGSAHHNVKDDGKDSSPAFADAADTFIDRRREEPQACKRCDNSNDGKRLQGVARSLPLTWSDWTTRIIPHERILAWPPRGSKLRYA